MGDTRVIRPYSGKIKTLRLEKAWTQWDLAEKSGVSVGTVRNVEDDKGVFPKSLNAIAGALGVDLQEIAVSDRSISSSSYFRGGVSSERSLRLGDALIVDETLFNQLASADDADVELFLLGVITRLKEQYKLVKMPVLLYNAGLPLASYLDKRFGDSKPFNLGRLHELLGYMLIISDVDAQTIWVAWRHLETAKTVYENANLCDEGVLKAVLRVTWLIAIAEKMVGGFDKAYGRLEAALKDKTLSKADLSAKVPLIRQQVIMEQSPESHRWLIRGLQEYTYDSVEYFHSVKRIFEWSLNIKDRRMMDEYYRRIIDAFRHARTGLEAVHKYSYLKDLYFYLRLTKDIMGAERIYARAERGAMSLEMFGQLRQIQGLKTELDFGETNVRIKSAVHVVG